MSVAKKSKTKSKNRKSTGGRPTKYSKEVLKKAKNYLKNYKKLGDEIPSNAGLAAHLDVSRQTINMWGNEEGKEEFSYTLERIQAKQEQVLLNKGLNGEFNSNITKLLLGNHGYHEKQETEVYGKGGGPIDAKWTVEIVDADPANPQEDAESP